MSDGNKPTRTTKNSSGSLSIGGNKLATSSLGPNGYSTKVNFDPNQQKIWDTSNKGIADLLGNIGGIVSTDPAKRESYRDQLYQPLADEITTNYDTARDRAYSRFASIGGLNSLGFNRYNNNMIDKNENKALSQAFNSADLQSYQLPSMLLSPIQQALGIYSGSQGQLYNQAMGAVGPTMQGQQLSNKYNEDNGLFNESGGSKKGFWGKYMDFIDPLKLMH